MRIGFVGISAVAMALGACGSAQVTPDSHLGAPPPLPPPGAVAVVGATVPCDAVQSSALGAALQARAAGDAPGMKPEGAPLCGVVGEGGEVASATFLLEQGFCYTVLGEGLPPVGEVDMVLKLDPSAPGFSIPPPLLALGQQPLMVDTMHGLQAGMGTKQGCYVWPFPMPGQVKLVVKSSKGGPGPVAAQVYKKKK